MKKLPTIILSLLLISSCSNIIQQKTNTTINEFSNLDQEYSQFKTQALTQSYLKKKMDKWLSSPTYSKNLVREIEYAKFKHKDILRDIVSLQPTMFDIIIANTLVINKRVDATFNDYIIYIEPYLSDINANNATGITETGYTANWNKLTNAIGYKLYLDGSSTPIILGDVNSYDVTGLTGASSHSYKLIATNNRYESPESNQINVITIPSAPVATIATNVMSTSFIANWNKVTGATGYKLIIDNGTPITLGDVDIYNVTGVIAGSHHNYKVKAYNSSGTSIDSNIINLLTKPVNNK